MFIANYLVLLPDRITLTVTLWLNPWKVSHINTGTNQSAFFWETALQVDPGIPAAAFYRTVAEKTLKNISELSSLNYRRPSGCHPQGFFNKTSSMSLVHGRRPSVPSQISASQPMEAGITGHWRRINKCWEGNQFLIQILCSQVVLVLLLSLERWTAKSSSRIWLLLKCPLDLRS